MFFDPRETNYAFCPSNGSLQIIFALVYAIATTEPQKQFLFVEKIPYYSFHEHAVTFRPYPNARFQGFNDPSEVKPKPNETVVEFVTSPNNPDGTFRKPYTQANIIIADLVFLHHPMVVMVRDILKTILLGLLRQGMKASMF